MYYILVARKPQFLYYDITFWMLMKFFYDDQFYLYLHVRKMCVCYMLMVYEINANLTHS